MSGYRCGKLWPFVSHAVIWKCILTHWLVIDCQKCQISVRFIRCKQAATVFFNVEYDACLLTDETGVDHENFIWPDLWPAWPEQWHHLSCLTYSKNLTCLIFITVPWDLIETCILWHTRIWLTLKHKFPIFQAVVNKSKTVFPRAHICFSTLIFLIVISEGTNQFW